MNLGCEEVESPALRTLEPRDLFREADDVPCLLVALPVGPPQVAHHEGEQRVHLFAGRPGGRLTGGDDLGGRGYGGGHREEMVII